MGWGKDCLLATGSLATCLHTKPAELVFWVAAPGQVRSGWSPCLLHGAQQQQQQQQQGLLPPGRASCVAVGAGN